MHLSQEFEVFSVEVLAELSRYQFVLHIDPLDFGLPPCEFKERMRRSDAVVHEGWRR